MIYALNFVYQSGWHINNGYGPGGWQHKNVDVVRARSLPPPRPDENKGGRPSLRGTRQVYDGKPHFFGHKFNAIDVRMIITRYYKTRGQDS